MDLNEYFDEHTPVHVSLSLNGNMEGLGIMGGGKLFQAIPCSNYLGLTQK